LNDLATRNILTVTSPEVWLKPQSQRFVIPDKPHHFSLIEVDSIGPREALPCDGPWWTNNTLSRRTFITVGTNPSSEAVLA
jgi:hypothetical protein